MSEVAIEFDHVWKKFRKGEIHDSLRDLIPAISRGLFSRNHKQDLREQEFWAVKDVSFQVKQGEVLGIIGPNGAGKSTILKLLSKILVPTQGHMRVNGKLSALIEIGAGFHPDLTGRENIYLNGTILGMKRQEIDRKLDEIIAFSGIEEFIDTPVKRYSSGMYARLGFSVAAHVDPEVLLVDEVLSVGDFPFQTKCLKRMSEIASGGTTIIFISHNIPSVIQLCPQSILLSKGQIQLIGPSSESCRFYYRGWADQKPADSKVKLEAVEVNAPDGSPCNTFGTGEWASAKFLVASREELRGVIMAFLIKRSDGLIMFDGNSEKIADKYFSFRAGETKTIIVDFRTNLPQGTYFLGLHFHTPDKGFHLYEDEAAEFHVTGPKTLGNAFLDTNWK